MMRLRFSAFDVLSVARTTRSARFGGCRPRSIVRSSFSTAGMSYGVLYTSQTVILPAREGTVVIGGCAQGWHAG